MVKDGLEVNIWNTNGTDLDREGVLKLDATITCENCGNSRYFGKNVDICSNIVVGCTKCDEPETMKKFSLIELLHEHLNEMRATHGIGHCTYWDRRYVNLKGYKKLYR